MQNFKEKLNRVNTFIFDVDGVLTNGKVILMPGGELTRSMNTRDGFAIQLAVKKGFNVAIITGGKSESVKVRLQKLGVKDIYLGVRNKKETMEDYIISNMLNKEEILYMGDDIPDYEAIQLAGVPTCPNDAAPEIKNCCIYVSVYRGGEGCARDVIEQTLKVQNKWDAAIDSRL